MIAPQPAAPGHTWSWPRSAAPVLVVEDEQPIRELIVTALADEGISVVAASNGAAALERVREHAPSVIVLDLHMPIMDGREFLAAYRALPGPHAPVLICSAGHRLQDVAEQLGAAAYVEKPFDLAVLVAAVDDLLRGGWVAGGAAGTAALRAPSAAR